MNESIRTCVKRTRASYSRLICLSCRERRIRCELPTGVEIPDPGEIRTIQTPCYRCKRLKIPCQVRQTILGRPSPEKKLPSNVNSPASRDDDTGSHVIIDLDTRPAILQVNKVQPLNASTLPRNSISSSSGPVASEGRHPLGRENVLRIHIPQSTESVLVIRALDTLRAQKVEEEWFRHLPRYAGHSRSLDLSIKALVAACAYTRGVPKLTSSDCYQSLSLALQAVHVDIKKSREQPNDAMLASTALLAPFEGVVKRHGIPTRFHLEGLAALLAARPATCPVTPLARDIIDWYACESATMACIHGTPSPFETVDRAYFVNTWTGQSDLDQATIKALSIEMLILIPRLVGIVRSLRIQIYPEQQRLDDALRLLQSLLRLQDRRAEARLLRNIEAHSSSELNDRSYLRQSFYYASAKDFEALICYWHARLTLLRLERQLKDLYNRLQGGSASTLSLRPKFGPQTEELSRMAGHILMSSQHAATLPLHKHGHMFAFAMLNVWGIWSEGLMDLVHDQDEGRSDLLLRRCNAALRKSDLVLPTESDFTMEDLNAAADTFTGGQPNGRLFDLYTF